MKSSNPKKILLTILLKSIKDAESKTKPVKDAVNKGAEKGDSKADKLKEDEDSNAEDTIVEKGVSKMENINKESQSTV